MKPTCEDCRLFNPNLTSSCEIVGYGTQAKNNPCDRFVPKPKPLAQYLSKYLDDLETCGAYGVTGDTGDLEDTISKALDAYESTENVVIQIIKKKAR